MTQLNELTVNFSSDSRNERLSEQKYQLNLSARRKRIGDLTIDEKANRAENIYRTHDNMANGKEPPRKQSQHKNYSHSNVDWFNRQEVSSARHTLEEKKSLNRT